MLYLDDQSHFLDSFIAVANATSQETGTDNTQELNSSQNESKNPESTNSNVRNSFVQTTLFRIVNNSKDLIGISSFYW